MVQQIGLLSIPTSPVASTAGNPWLLFLMGRTLIAVMKHVKKIFLLNYSTGSVFASPTDCGETEAFGFRGQKTLERCGLLFCTGANDTGFTYPTDLKVNSQHKAL